LPVRILAGGGPRGPISIAINVSTNAWFSGFFDAEGDFSIRNQYTLTISIGQKYVPILEIIQNSFGGGKIYFDTSWNGYNYCITDKENIIKLLEYFSKYNLRTVLNVDCITFRRLLLFLERGYHISPNPILRNRIDNLIRLFRKRKK
jgi:LAGLIDADG endonuclease